LAIQPWEAASKSSEVIAEFIAEFIGITEFIAEFIGIAEFIAEVIVFHASGPRCRLHIFTVQIDSDYETI